MPYDPQDFDYHIGVAKEQLFKKAFNSFDRSRSDKIIEKTIEEFNNCPWVDKNNISTLTSAILAVSQICEAGNSYIGEKQMLSLLETENILELERKYFINKEFNSIASKLYAFKDITRDTEIFLDFLNINRKHLIETGYFVRINKSVYWLNEILANLYFVRVPFNIHKLYIRPDEVHYIYTWKDIECERERKKISYKLEEEMAKRQTKAKMFDCVKYGYIIDEAGEKQEKLVNYINMEFTHYKDADLIYNLDLEDNYLLESKRQNLFELKYNIISQLLFSIQKNDLENIWEQCVKLFKKYMSIDDLQFFTKVEQIYIKMDKNFSQIPFDKRLTYNAGGIWDLFEVIACYEMEFKKGIYSKIRNIIGDGLFLNEDGLPDIKINSYFQMIRENGKEKTDIYFNDLIALKNEAGEFVSEYIDRLLNYLRESLYKEVIYKKKVPSKTAKNFEKQIDSCAQFLKSQLEIHGEIPPNSLVYSHPLKQLEDNSITTKNTSPTIYFYSEGDVWRIGYEKNLHTISKASKGCHHIQYLIKNRHQLYIHPFEVFHDGDIPKELKEIINRRVPNEKISAKELNILKKEKNKLNAEINEIEKNKNISSKDKKEIIDSINREIEKFDNYFADFNAKRKKYDRHLSEKRAYSAVQKAIQTALKKILACEDIKQYFDKLIITGYKMYYKDAPINKNVNWEFKPPQG